MRLTREIERVMRMMTGLGLFTETALDTYTLTPNGAGFVSASPLSAAVHNLYCPPPSSIPQQTNKQHRFQMGQLTTHIPSFLARTSYANPTDALHTPFQDAMDTELTYFDWIKARPVDHEMFNRTMALNQAWRGVSWFEYFPVASKLSSSSEETLLVDVGGGVGIDILAFQKAFPDLKGKLVLQDLPSVVDGLQLPQGVKAQGHDFFSPQPVKNAKAYYMRNILHDWPDKQALQILGHVKEAMGKESLLLVNEGVVPEMGTSLMQAQFDINMMGIGALDRTEREYENLFESAGLRVVGRHVPEVLVLGTGTVFEVVLA